MTISRADRRHNAERVKANRAKYYCVGVAIAETPKLCSCPMCGNPRKWFKARTIQERRMFWGGPNSLLLGLPSLISLDFLMGLTTAPTTSSIQAGAS